LTLKESAEEEVSEEGGMKVLEKGTMESERRKHVF